MGGARGGLQEESSSPEQGHHQRTGEQAREMWFLFGMEEGVVEVGA